MKKLICLLLCCMVLAGCGSSSKSDAELTNIEQFKCQDSIQTVFDVLGKTEVEENSLIGECCRYENLNLWGYSGEALFRLRDDKDTIASFECNFKLNKKEFEDILAQLTDKYGEYEKSEYSNQIAYVWEVEEEKSENIGYNRISLSDYGDKKVIVDFSDEWSTKTDEAYYKHLDEETNNEDDLNVLSKKTYNIGDDTFDFVFGEDGAEKRFYLYCNIKEKIDACYTHVSLNALMNSTDENIKVITDDFNFSYSIAIGDGTVLLRMPGFLSLVKDGETIEVEEYFSAEWLANEAGKESDYGTKVIEFMMDFIENN